MSFLREFKEFALRGNVIDMAVGVIVGGAFGKIITSLVSDMLMPVVSLITSKTEFSNMQFVLKPATIEPGGKTLPPVAIHYGNFIQSSVDFIIVAFCVFLLVQLVNKIARQTPKSEEPLPLSSEEKLLSEIRDLLKAQQSH